MSKSRARTCTDAKVTITLELSNLGSWGPDCTTGQVHDQAREAAIGRLNKVFKDHIADTRVVGSVIVEAVSTTLEKREPLYSTCSLPITGVRSYGPCALFRR